MNVDPGNAPNRDRPPKIVRVAVVGSGLAGLTATHLLATTSNDDIRFDVHLFEKSNSIGMDDKSISVSSKKGKGQEHTRIDVPMRSFQGGYYTNLIAFYKHLGVAFDPSDFAYSFSTLASSALGSSTSVDQLNTRLIYNGKSGLGGISLPSQLRPRSSAIIDPVTFHVERYGLSRFLFITIPTLFLFGLTALRLLYNFARFCVLSTPLYYQRASLETFGEWTTRQTPRGYLARLTGADNSWTAFIHEVVVPLFSAVCTAPEDAIYHHPASEILEYVWRTQLTHHYRVTNGVQDAVRRITDAIPKHNIHLSSTITSLSYSRTISPATLSIEYTTGSETLVLSDFHHIVFATQANQAIPLLESYQSSLPPPSPLTESHQSLISAQISILKRFKYVRNVVINHTDSSPSFLPPNPSDRRDLNLVCAEPSFYDWSLDPSSSNRCVPPSFTMATHIITPPNSKAIKGGEDSTLVVYQTTNPIVPPRKDKILSTAIIERAVLTPDAKLAQRELMIEADELVEGVSEEGWTSLLPESLRPRRRVRKLGPLQGAGRLRRDGADDESLPPGVWLCGSYAHPGIPLLESCVTSALNVVLNGVYVAEGLDEDKRAGPEWAQKC